MYESDTLSSGQLISKTLDIAAKFQQSAEPNHAQISEATISLLGVKAKAFRRAGWNAALGTNVYDYSAGGLSNAAKARKLPQPAHVLIVEPELNEMAKLKKTLFGNRYDPFTVYDQNQAALAMGSWTPHLVLLSLDLPWKTGWEFLGSLRADAKCRICR